MTRHAEQQRQERNISLTWIEQTIEQPHRQEMRDDDTTHYIRQISEFGNRWLRVVMNETIEPNTIITVFFDRRVQ